MATEATTANIMPNLAAGLRPLLPAGSGRSGSASSFFGEGVVSPPCFTSIVFRPSGPVVARYPLDSSLSTKSENDPVPYARSLKLGSSCRIVLCCCVDCCCVC